MTQEVIIPAGTTRGDFSVSIPVTVDSINEYDEGFLIALAVSQETANMAEAPTIQLQNDGLTLGIIENDDSECYASIYRGVVHHLQLWCGWCITWGCGVAGVMPAVWCGWCIACT